MTTFTDKELIKEIKERIGGLDVRDNIERRAYEIALASLEAEPVAWKVTFTQIDHEYNTFTAMYSDKAEAERWVRLHKVGDFRAEITPLYAAPPALVVPDEMDFLTCHLDGVTETYADGWNACRAAMLQSQGEGNPHVTPARLPGGFTIEDAKELHEDLVRSHISQALSGEKMKKKDRDADLRWIHGVIVQAAWFVKASLEQAALSGTPPVTPDDWISCSERMPDSKTAVLVAREFDRKGDWRMKWATYIPGHPDANDGWIIPGASWIPSHWMPLPEPPQEAK
ncbi:TPA: DUF551 domain-containing protein [Escherichia coli]|nr:DUF551 domain-containing protein [Escherichia coli]